MEEIFSRFPHLGDAIMDQLDNTDLTDCRLVDRIWRNFIDNQKLQWMRIIFKWTAYYNQEWQEISIKLNSEMVKILAKTVNKLLTDGEDIDPIDQTPLVIAAISGNTEIVAKLFKKEAFENYDDDHALPGYLGSGTWHCTAVTGYEQSRQLLVDFLIVSLKTNLD